MKHLSRYHIIYGFFILILLISFFVPQISYQFRLRFARLFNVVEGAQVEERVKIVDFGAGDYLRSAAYEGLAFMRSQSITMSYDYDVDDDGVIGDDGVAYSSFSLTEPLNPQNPRFSYFTTATNPVYYGGVTSYYANLATSTMVTCGENSMNPDHIDGSREDMSTCLTTLSGTSTDPNYWHSAYAFYLWKKEDFLNRGDVGQVSFDTASLLSITISRQWYDWDQMRFVVQQGANLYVSEANTRPEENVIDTSLPSFLWEIDPTETNWSLYQPQEPFEIEFDPTEASFSPLALTDVQGVGIIFIRLATSSPSSINREMAKWSDFEIWANVSREWQPSELLEMVEIPTGESGGVQVPAFYMSTKEISYADWHTIHDWSLYRYYRYNNDGDMGSMDYLNLSHSSDEPVTDVSFTDVIAYANALSEYEGKTACYYTDPTFTQVARMMRDGTLHSSISCLYSSCREYEFTLPDIYIDWSCDGYRLPTITEWEYAFGASASGQGWIGSNAENTTHDGGALTVNSHNLYDMLGNVWEYVWDANSIMTPGDPHTVLGGDFHYPTDSRDTSLATMVSYYPHRGSYNIGFRLVRSLTGHTPPQGEIPSVAGYSSGSIPEWTFTNETEIPAQRTSTITLSLESVPAETFTRNDGTSIAMNSFDISPTEIPFNLWRDVRSWAVDNGYEFDNDGDMGSMDSGDFTHSPSEPVTDISWQDAIVWSNAFSEYEGKEPCFFGDAGKTEVLRKSKIVRPFYKTWDERAADSSLYRVTFNNLTLYYETYIDWSCNGYRLPSETEWEYMARAGSPASLQTNYPFNVSGIDNDSVWWANNAGGKTQPVGTKSPNAWGLYDTSGNVFEWLLDKSSAHSKSSYFSWDPDNPSLDLNDSSSLIRGGSFGSWGSAYRLGTGTRYGISKIKPYYDIGFRVIGQASAVVSNEAPILEAIGNKSVNESSELTFEVSATDANYGQTVTITTNSLPSGASFDGITFSWTPTSDQVGEHSVTFTATDDFDSPASTSETIVITVGSVANPVCEESWTCGDWSVCQESQQARTCTDQNSCNTTVSRPPLSQSCTNSTNSPSSGGGGGGGGGKNLPKTTPLDFVPAVVSCPFLPLTALFATNQRGDHVKQLQQMLTHFNYYSGPINGFYDTATVLAVQAFQRQEQLASSGSPETTGYGLSGPETRKRLNQLCAQQNQGFSMTEAERLALIRQIQEQLVQLMQQLLTLLLKGAK